MAIIVNFLQLINYYNIDKSPLPSSYMAKFLFSDNQNSQEVYKAHD
jgi:hypothetical protein